MHHWLVLSKHLALQEFHKDILEDQFVALDHTHGYSQSAVGVADLMKAVSAQFHTFIELHSGLTNQMHFVWYNTCHLRLCT